MAYFGSFVVMALIPFVLGFAATGFWRRWGTLLPIGTGVVIVGAVQYSGALSGDGPGLPVGILLAWFFVLGAVCGSIASGTVLIGRGTGWKVLRPTLIIPAILVVGFGGPMAFYFAEAMMRDAKMAPPPQYCFKRLYPARIAGVDLSLPAAPGISFFQTGSNRLFGMWHNPDLRTLCSQSADQTTEMRAMTFMLHESFWSTQDARDLFCSRQHPEYPWAAMVCDPKAGSKLVLDKPGFVRVEVIDPASLNKGKSAAPPDFPMTASPDGSKIYRDGDAIAVLTPDGDRADCGRIGRDKYLHCDASGKLSDELAISYEFWADGDAIEQEMPRVAAAARDYFRSLVR